MGILAGAIYYADINLIVMGIGFLILFLAIISAKRKNFTRHIKLADTTVILACLSFIWMGFSLISNYLGGYMTGFTALVIASHATIGFIALFTGISFTLNRIKKTQNIMRGGFLLWTMAISSGFLLYLVYYDIF